MPGYGWQREPNTLPIADNARDAVAITGILVTIVFIGGVICIPFCSRMIPVVRANNDNFDDYRRDRIYVFLNATNERERHWLVNLMRRDLVMHLRDAFDEVLRFLLR